MGKNSRMQNHINEIKRKTQYFWSHKGKRFCAAMLCASMVMGNAGSIANASNVIVSGESSLATPSNTVDTATPSNGNELHRFQLTGEELYEAWQNAIAGDARADVEFTGGSSAEYEDFFLEPGDYYELNLENGKKGNRTELRIFARIEESELVEGERDDYVIDGTEELMLLAVNRSEKDQKVTVAVDEKHTPEFVIPVNVKSDAELITSPSPVIDTTKTGEEAETATPSNGMPATPSDSEEVETEIPEEKPADELEGEIYELTSVEEGTAVGFLTTTGSLGLDDMSLIATDSNALTRYSMPVDGAENILVDVTAKRGTIPEGAELRARYLTEDGNEYQDVKNALDEANEEYGGMMALDIGFWLNDEEIEPEPGSEVQVKIRMDANLLPDDVDVGTLKVQHHAETDQGIRIETVAKAVTVEEDETAAVPMTMSLMSLNADAVPLEEEILDDVIIEEADPENPVETIMDTVNAEPGTLKVIETDGEAAVVETAFVVDGFSKFTITWRSWSSKRLVTVRYVEGDRTGNLIPGLNPEMNGASVQVSRDFKMSDYIVSSSEYQFQKIVLLSSSGVILETTDSSDIFGESVNGSYRLFYKNQRGGESEVPNESIIYLIYDKIQPLPTFLGEDTEDLIQIQLFDYNEYQKVTDNFVFGGNGYTGGQGGGVKQGLVKPLLKNGYPVLKEDNKSLSCLFSKDGDYVQSGSYRNANYLLQQNPEDYAYYYDSNTNFASVDENGDFVLYETARYPDETTPPSEPKFLPYNTIINKVTTLENVYDGDPDKGERYREYAIGNGETENFGFGMTIDFDFIMPKDGKINGNDMVFNFQGDDDVWVFIDDVLVLDLGGVHDNYEGSINFQTGAVYVEKVNGTGNPQNTTISAMFQKAEKSWDASDYKNHELKFFYLERGRGGSNCTIEFNMPPIPKGTINFQKEIAYSNVKDVSDIDFKFKTFVNYGGTSSESDYKLYTGPYEVYNASDFDNPVRTERTAEDGIILLKDDQMARLTDSAIQATSKYYIQEIGATSDKFDVSIDGVNVEIIYEDGSTTEEKGVETDKLSVDNNPYVVFKNSVSADNMFNLRIDKVMSDGPSPDAEFPIQVLLGLEDKKPYTGEYKVFEDGRELGTKIASDEGILTLKAGQYAVITELMGGNKITVQETEYGGRKAPTYEMTGPLAGEPIVSDNSISGIAKEGNDLGYNPEVKVTVTNYPLPGLTVRKTVSGNMGDRNREFDFTVQAQNSKGEAVSVDGTYEGITVDKDGQFKLKHGQSLVIPELPYGVTCTVTESIPEEEGYTTTVKVDGGEEKSSKTVTVENMNTAAVIDFTNTKGLNVPTGIFTDNLPYLVMLAMAAIGLTGFGRSRRRVKKSRDDD